MNAWSGQLISSLIDMHTLDSFWSVINQNGTFSNGPKKLSKKQPAPDRPRPTRGKWATHVRSNWYHKTKRLNRVVRSCDWSLDWWYKTRFTSSSIQPETPHGTSSSKLELNRFITPKLTCRAPMAALWKRRSVLKSWAISLTSRWKGSLRISSSVDFWYRRISRRATVPGLERQQKR